MSAEIMHPRQFMGRLAPAQDLYQALTDLCVFHGVTLGHIQGIGAVTRAVIGYYDPNAGKYIENTFPHQMEIVSLNANLSIRNGKPFVHAHIALGDMDGRVYGGHLMPGTEIFVFEYVLTVGEGFLERVHAPDLNLALWPV